MQNNELKDILLDRDDELKSQKLKKLLMIIAALCVLFLIVIATMKILNSNEQEQTAQIDSRLVLPPMPDEGVATQDTAKKSDEQLFKQVPIVPENKAEEDFDEMVKRLKDKEKPQEPVKEIATSQTPKDTPVVVKKDAVIKPAEVKDVAKKDEKKADKKKAEPVKTAKDSPKQKTPLEATLTKQEKIRIEPQQKPQPSQNVQSQNLQSGAYVQAFATKSAPDARELAKISSKGYTYKTLKVDGVTKVLIGPFSGENLKNELANIRKEINKGAFVYRVK
ncbi:SPOR domain-containing protein [Campylobacter gastrosuis]|uniref:SPOR domain-containing protein n=1 Tax=Campylobacter gastrosuis TaxID=2974576 RepID=A0ABT7HQ48_9BACT|nr:SPOR domain-containing protein [Campylobacter gastrosuis]MDL0088553.1 SPOR domain-containing protein [Campylobacter gastrosuis]